MDVQTVDLNLEAGKGGRRRNRERLGNRSPNPDRSHSSGVPQHSGVTVDHINIHPMTVERGVHWLQTQGKHEETETLTI